MTTRGHLLFDSPVGRCGLAWRDGAIAALQLPEPDDRQTLVRMIRRTLLDDDAHDALARNAFPGSSIGALTDSPPDWVRDVIAQIEALLRGEPQKLQDVPLDWRQIAPFARRVYRLARTIPPGQTLTYGEIARLLGDPGASRAVGQALGHNPFAIIVPCHRVLAASGRSGGFSANGGVRTKLALLSLESQHQARPEGDLFGWHT